jgi:phytanoyl-CoA hydroxylase
MDAREVFAGEGYWVERGLFSRDEIERVRERFGEINQERRGVVDDGVIAGDPLAEFPRVMMPHKFDALSRDWLLDKRLRQVFERLLGAAPVAVQTMFYF